MYLVIEIQQTGNTVAIPTPIYSSSDERQAESEFHRLCSIAAVSKVPRHTVMFIETSGEKREVKTWEHEQE